MGLIAKPPEDSPQSRSVGGAGEISDESNAKQSAAAKRILFIDDEDVILRAMAVCMEGCGLEVVTEGDPVEALRIFRNEPDGFDLVVTDQTMPHITGDALACELLTIRPDLPIILCTGYSEEIDEQRAIALGIRRFLMKPISPGALIAIIKEVLDER